MSELVSDQLSKVLAMASTFVSGVLAINVSQVLGAPISLVNKEWYNSWIAHTKKSFAVLTMTMTEKWAPTVVKVSGDASMRGQLFHSSKGELLCNFPRRLVMIANHQIYTDWLYLWWIAYTNGMHGRIYIILKESLKRIPVIGWGMQLYQFIFLKRNWESDKPNVAKNLMRLKNVDDPMWLLLFPEGTNLAPSTREASKKWATKNGIKDLKHLLLPRSTGLQFCIQELEETLGYVYDCTIAYDGVKPGEYAQDIYTLQASYVNGKPPKCVNMYWRRFNLSTIPVHDTKAFELWLRARWIEKDALLEYYHRNGRFPADTGREIGPSGRTRRGCGYIETTIKMNRWYEFLQTFMPMGLLAMVLYSFYGSLPEAILKNIAKEGVMDNINKLEGSDLPTAQKEALLKAASQATGVKSVNVQPMAPKVQQAKPKQVAAPAKPAQQKSKPAQQQVKPATGKPKRYIQLAPQAGSANTTASQPAAARRPSIASQATTTTTAFKKAPKLGPRKSTAPSSAASTVGSAPKLGPRKTTPAVASSKTTTAPAKAPQKTAPKATTPVAAPKMPAVAKNNAASKLTR